MRRLWTFWLVGALALITAVFAASALAGDGQGHDGQGGGGQSSQSSQQSSGGHDQSSQQKSSEQQSQSSNSQSSKSESSKAPSGGGQDQSGQQKQSDQKSKVTIQVVTNSQSSDQSSGNGVKPSNDTLKNTSTHVGDKPDVSKRYGNGKTAAEIAKSHGAPDSTVLTGPGNSQPHKVVTCKHPHGVDVHAVKSYSGDDCTAAKVDVLKTGKEHSTEQHSTETPKAQESASLGSDHKVTLCHLTGNGSFVAITVDKHALKEGHTTAKGDIIPMPAGGCGAVLGAQATLGTPCASGASTSDDDESKDQGGQQGEFKGEHQDSQGSSDSKDNDDDESTECTTAATGTAGASAQILTPAAPQATVQAAQPAQQVAATQTVQQQTPATTATSTTAAVSASNAQPATQGTPNAAAAPQGQGGVLGATATLNTPKRSNGGVLGAAANIAGATLPFTGFPVWVALLVALALVAVGLVLRRSGGTATRL